MPQLRIKSGLEQGKVFDLEGDSIKIGRDPECLIELGDSGVSREHAEIYRVGQMFFVRDLGSRNGILVNDLQVEDELLRDGDMIRLASYVLVFESTATAADGHHDHFYGDDEHDPGETMVMTIDPETLDPADSGKIRRMASKMADLVETTTKTEALVEGTLNLLMESLDVMEVFIFSLEPGNRLAQKGHRLADGEDNGKASRSIVLRAIKDRTTIVTANAMEDFRFKAESSISLKNVNSVLCCPLISMGQDIGVFYLNNGPNFQPFSQDSAELVQTIASHFAPALQILELRKSEANIADRSVKLLSDTIETQNAFLKGRGKRVAALSSRMGKLMGLKRNQLMTLHMASFLHHIGYMTMNTEGMGQAEVEKDLAYVKHSTDLLDGNDQFVDVKNAIENHRYRLDGKGVPSELNIPSWTVESQILGICVELDLRLNLPMAFGRDPEPISDAVEAIIEDGTKIFTRPLVNFLQKAWRKGVLVG